MQAPRGLARGAMMPRATEGAAPRPAGGLAIREDRRRGLFVEGLSEWEV